MDIDQKTSPVYEEYMKHFEGGSIPYWAVLDAKGKKVHGFVGGQSYESLLGQTSKFK